MLGFRGCRLGIVYLETFEMQARAVFEAAAEVEKSGVKVKPEGMGPLVSFKRKAFGCSDSANAVERLFSGECTPGRRLRWRRLTATWWR